MPRKFLRNLQIGFGISLVILLASSTASFVSIKQQINNRDKVDHTRRVISAANKVLIDLQNAETGQRGYYLTGKESFLEPYLEALVSLPGSLKVAQDLTKDHPVQSKRSDSLTYLVNTRVNILTNLVNIKKGGGSITTAQLEEGKTYMDSCRNIISTFIQEEEHLLDERTEALNESSKYTSIFIIVAAVLSLVITFSFYRRIREDFNK